ncbi:hypothetical protein PGTUg99_026289 [Puccinia graminis f. sp. tritici]|uniref:Uncharacterized protein n=1 Tax=Puccinia graminis f. sp. tritici TaxID=56615 RepID=A0A5B0RFN7_PUCGR|nr:hypothetical protein PGTUg99_026289 [Puccinia graminis f. sp. tritici]
MYLIQRKETLPLDEVHVPHPSEGNPSAGRGTCTLSIGRKPFRWTRYMYLVQRKESLPLGRGTCTSRPLEEPSAWTRYMYLVQRKESLPMDPAEGFPSAGRGTCTSSKRKAFLPMDEVHVPRPAEGNPSDGVYTARREGFLPAV